jgi:CubicO group peptidase (beta-lactamase class C family)
MTSFSSRHSATLPLLFFVLIICGCFRATAQGHTTDAELQLRAKVDSMMRTVPDFSGVVHLALDRGRTVFEKAYGYRSYQDQVPLKATDLFELASISKTFTAMAIVSLKQEGKLSYDDPIAQYISIPYPGITIRHLLNHTSGLPDYQAVMDQHWDKTKVAGNPDIIAYLSRYMPPALFLPGEAYEYSNTGYVLLGSIVEKVSGMDFTVFCRNRFFKPLGMSRTDIRSNEAKKMIPDFTLGHIWVDARKQFIRADSFPSSDYTIWLGNRKGPGRVSSVTQDLQQWDIALYGNKLFSRTALEEAFTPGRLNNGKEIEYGFGWMIHQHEKLGRIIWHSGDNPGYRTRLMRYVDKGITLIVLCNNAYPGFDRLMDKLEGLLY